MDNSVVTLGLVGLCVGVAGTALYVAFYFRGLVDKCRSDLDGALAAQGEAFRGELAGQAKEFSDYKQHVAEQYMSKVSGGMAIDRAVSEMKGFREDIRINGIDLSNRLGRVEGLLMRSSIGSAG